jgi:hypothetical protein
MRRFSIVTSLIIGAVLLAGCVPLQTYEEAKEKTHAAMQHIVDQLPANVEIEDMTLDKPGPCAGDGGSYTGQWFATVDDGFDGAAFIETLPGKLPRSFREFDSGVEWSSPDVNFFHDAAYISVEFYDRRGYHGVFISAISRCAQLPDGYEGQGTSKQAAM